MLPTREEARDNNEYENLKIEHVRNEEQVKNLDLDEKKKNTSENNKEIKKEANTTTSKRLPKKKGKIYNFLYGDTKQMQINANKIKLDTDGKIIDGEFYLFTSSNIFTLIFV